MMKTMWGGVIGFLWQWQHVVIVKLSTKLDDQEGYYAPCSKDFYLNYGPVRVCDGDTAYFFIRKGSESLPIGTSYPEVPGIKKETLGNYSLDLLTVAKGAEWTQNTFGFGENFNQSTHDAIADMYLNPEDSTNTANNTFISVPFCDLDWLKHNGPNPWAGMLRLWSSGKVSFSQHSSYMHALSQRLTSRAPSKNSLGNVIYNACGSMEVKINGETQNWPYKEYPKKKIAYSDAGSS
ncbi:hypothetical protein N7492_006270 [Penicillium capsulatum]|uniref:Uncharacterized protein n=1 Tax=Penicillium capsulatum TaxID=69766 RepID=A0A9W9I143_9EURO|nr:hypothetical protein N7492_006270 [Penicillium capsulatum]